MNVDELAGSILKALPDSARALREDLEKNLRAAIEASLRRMQLVTREEFDVQAAVLARTRARLEQLEAQIARLEARTGQDAAPSSSAPAPSSSPEKPD